MRRNSQPYRALFFDVGGTLLSIRRDPQLAALEAISHLGEPPPNYPTVIRQVYADWRTSGGAPEAEDLPETWVSHHRRALALSGFSGDIDAAAQMMEDVFLKDGWQVYHDVFDVLKILKQQGYELGIISNWPSTLESTLEKSGLSPYFKVIVGSGKVGYAKPHPRIFQIASERMGVEVDQSLYIGDSVEHDVRGAEAAGMDVILVSRDERADSHQTQIRSLHELHLFLNKRGTPQD